LHQGDQLIAQRRPAAQWTCQLAGQLQIRAWEVRIVAPPPWPKWTQPRKAKAASLNQFIRPARQFAQKVVHRLTHLRAGSWAGLWGITKWLPHHPSFNYQSELAGI